MKYWLMKTEPDVFSWADLEQKKIASWDGVRNYQARNFMRDEFEVGDKVLFYHSSCAEPGIAGIANIVRGSYADPTALDKNSEYFDPALSRSSSIGGLVIPSMCALMHVLLKSNIRRTRQMPILSGSQPPSRPRHLPGLYRRKRLQRALPALRLDVRPCVLRYQCRGLLSARPTPPN